MLATGGMGQIFASTTNPAVSTGDGVALALRAGATVTDLEFVQFHPTALCLGRHGAPSGQQPLVSEAMRGEGALLVDARGERVMERTSTRLRTSAPRDVVAKAMSRVHGGAAASTTSSSTRGIWGRRSSRARFPTILASCRAVGVDPVCDPIPVAPAAHYASGGVRTDLAGGRSVPGPVRLRRGGVHGSARRQPAGVQQLARGRWCSPPASVTALTELPPQTQPVQFSGPAGLRRRVGPQRACAAGMTEGAGVLRSGSSLAGGRQTLQITQRTQRPTPDAGVLGGDRTW